MMRKRWRFTGNLTRLHATEELTYPNRVYITNKGWAGLYLFNIVLFGYKLWFGFFRDMEWVWPARKIDETR